MIQDTWLYGKKEQGEKRMDVEIPDAYHQVLKHVAKETGTTIKQHLNEAIRRYLEKNESLLEDPRAQKQLRLCPYCKKPFKDTAQHIERNKECRAQHEAASPPPVEDQDDPAAPVVVGVPPPATRVGVFLIEPDDCDHPLPLQRLFPLEAAPFVACGACGLLRSPDPIECDHPLESRRVLTLDDDPVIACLQCGRLETPREVNHDG